MEDPISIKEWQELSHEISVEKGWWEKERLLPENISLFHSEVSEMLKEFRNGHAENEVYLGPDGKPEGIPIEAADLLIRVFDWAEEKGVDLQSALVLKSRYNKKRPYRHGNKVV